MPRVVQRMAASPSLCHSDRHSWITAHITISVSPARDCEHHTEVIIPAGHGHAIVSNKQMQKALHERAAQRSAPSLGRVLAGTLVLPVFLPLVLVP